MHKRKIVDLWYFTVCCKRRKRGSGAGSSEAPVLRLFRRGCFPHAGSRAGAMTNTGDGPGTPRSAGLCCHHGSASAEPGGRPRHLPPPQAPTALPPGRGSPIPPAAAAPAPPARPAAADDTDGTACPLHGPPSLLSRPAYSLSRGGAQTRRRRTNLNKKKRAAEESAGLCACLVWRNGG